MTSLEMTLSITLVIVTAVLLYCNVQTYKLYKATDAIYKQHIEELQSRHKADLDKIIDVLNQFNKGECDE